MLLPVWVAFFAAGIAAGVLLPIVGAICLMSLAVVLGGWRATRRQLVGSGAALALMAGTAVGLRARPPPLAPLTDPEPVPQQVLASVIRGPEPEDAVGSRSRLWLELHARDGRAAAGVLVLGVPGSPRDVGPGDEVSFRAALHEPMGLANPGLPDPRVAARAAGEDFFAALGPAERLQVVRAGSVLGPRRIAWRLRTRLAEEIAARVPATVVPFLLTVALGERAGVASAVEDGFRAAGATHVLSVSGLHLAAVAALVFFLVRRVAAAVPGLALRVNAGGVAAAVALPVVALYTLLTGEAVATERSAWMAAAALAGTALGRRSSLATSVAAAALVLLARAPLALFDVSFQLSFASVIALGLFARRLAPAAAAAGSSWAGRLRAWLGRFAAATLAASAVTAPLVAHHFGEMTPAAPLGNLALVPLIELVILPLSLGGALLAMIHRTLGFVPLTLAGWAASVSLHVADLFRRFAPVVLVRFPDAFETGALMMAAAALLGAVSGVARARLAWLAAVAMVVAGVSLGGREIVRRRSEEVRITFLDVGQGDAAVIEGPGDFVAVVDAGGTYDDSFDTGARVVEPFLRARGISHVDLVVLSHPHPDHLNGLFRVLARFPVGALWTSGDDGHNPRYAALLALATQRSVATPVPRAFRRGRLVLEPLGPFVGDAIGPPPGTSVNDASLVVRLGFAGRAVLFPGDLEGDGEAELVGRAAAGMSVGSDVLKVPHHGSRTSSSADLLDAVRPALAVISLGRHNRFHFPRPEVIARYRARGVRVLRTDEVGAVTVSIAPSGRESVRCVRSCPDEATTLLSLFTQQQRE